jgi:hypothetical protein
MTDELTPEEREAFDKLPRERMPAGLEERVVGAMREHGFLAKRRRTIELTNGRVAGLLAASVALVIGAYSIGLNRGDVRPMPGVVETKMPVDHGRAEKSLAPPPEVVVEPQAAAEPTLELKRENAAPSAAAPSARKDEEASAGRIAQEKMRDEDRAVSAGESAASPPTETPAPPTALKPAARTPTLQEGAVSSAAKKTPLTFYVDGSPVTVEAPDSVRVVQDDQGRMLIIYTSDGIIRIRLGDN